MLLGMVLSRFLLVRLLVRLSIAVWPRENWRGPRSSASFSTTLLVSRSGVDRSRNRRPASAPGAAAAADGATSREFRLEGTSLRRGSADWPSDVLSGAGTNAAKKTRREKRRPATSVTARD